MYLVRHHSFGSEKSFETYHAAKAFILRAAFEASLWHGQHHLASYSPIGGWSIK